MEIPLHTQWVLDLSQKNSDIQSYNKYKKTLLGVNGVCAAPPIDYYSGKLSTISAFGIETEPFGETTYAELISMYDKVFAEASASGAEFVLLLNADTLSECRAAAIAAKNRNISLIVMMTFEDDMETKEGSNLYASLVTLQGMGIFAFAFSCPNSDIDELHDIIAEMLKYATVPIGVAVNFNNSCTSPASMGIESFIKNGASFVVVDELLSKNDVVEIAGCVINSQYIKSEPEFFDETISANQNQLFFLGEHVVISEEIDCNHDMSEEILAAEALGCDILNIVIETADDGYLFSLNTHMLGLPVLLTAHSEKGLDNALIGYHGIALIDQHSELENGMLEELAKKYNAVII